MHRLSCSMARGIFLDLGIKPKSPAFTGRLLTTEPPGKPKKSVLDQVKGYWVQIQCVTTAKFLGLSEPPLLLEQAQNNNMNVIEVLW